LQSNIINANIWNIIYHFFNTLVLNKYKKLKRTFWKNIIKSIVMKNYKRFGNTIF
jgi:hypothetical protein